MYNKKAMLTDLSISLFILKIVFFRSVYSIYSNNTSSKN